MRHIVHIALHSYITWLVAALLGFRFVLPVVICALGTVLEGIGSFGQGWH